MVTVKTGDRSNLIYSSACNTRFTSLLWQRSMWSIEIYIKIIRYYSYTSFLSVVLKLFNKNVHKTFSKPSSFSMCCELIVVWIDFAQTLKTTFNNKLTHINADYRYELYIRSVYMSQDHSAKDIKQFDKKTCSIPRI